ncbi:MAG: type II restriction endonuclease, partial [Tissierellia bacterium]|nr:type II restriction endonuclease [Tissierellia bacterium]
LDIFDRFNFTINEAEPLEKDVAVDPEMLGKIFEELLEVSDRKSKGAFYTPREIVHYMCQESLINHLVNEVGVPYEDMKEFILYGELIRDADNRRNVGYGKGFTIKESILNNISEIDDALRDVRVADPAVGSGAFPLGMLNEIVKARNNITEYIIRKDKEGAFGEKYGEEFIRNWRSPYQMKLDTIKDSIFAVDIEPSAIDITKLRLWLSIVVDQEIDGINIEPNPLPNLDMNIHVGNSLIDEYEGIKLFDKSILEKKKKNEKKKNQKIEQMRLFFDSEEILNEMFEKQSQYFAEVDEGNKEFLKLRIDELRDQLINQRLREAGNTEAIEKYKEIKKEKTKPYFIWELEFAKVFKEKGGFDIVIGNPPYVGESGNKDIFRPIAETEFGKKHYLGKMDLFYFFFHIALDIGNENSEISFITTNYYPTAFGAKRLRLDLKERSYIRKLIDFNELKIFDSARGQHNMITILTKRKDEDIIAETCLTSRTGDADSKILNAITSWEDKQSKYNNLNQDNIYEGEENYIRLNGVLGSTVNSIESVIGKLSKLEVRLGDIAEINQGVVTGCDYISGRNINKITDKSNIEKNDGIFVLDMLNKRDSKKLNDFNEGVELLRDFYKNSDIERYWCKTYPEKKIIYYPDKLDGNKYPDILEHLLPYKEILESRLKTYNEKYHWTAIHRPRSERIFNECKIVVPYRAKKNNFAYNDVEWFCRSDVYVITQKDPKYNLKYLLALLNSKPYYTWLYYKGKRKGETLELFQVPLSEIPIKNVNQNTQNKIISIVDDILDITIQEDYLRNLEKHNKVSEYAREIDQIVYDLYNFTEEEIKLIEEHYGEE